MDPTTAAHVEPVTLTTTTTADGSPALTFKSDTTATSVPLPPDHADSTSHDSRPSSGGQQQAADALDAAQRKASDTAAAAQQTAAAAAATTQDKAARASAATQATASEAATGVRKRVNVLGSKLDETKQHPAVQNARKTASKQVAQLREFLGRSQVVRDLEKRTNVDRVILVPGGAFLFALLVPLNVFGLALPVTTLLAVAPAAYLAIEAMETGASDEQVKSLLSYFVVLGFVQLLESTAAGVLEKRIPHYYTLKLAFLAYLLHPKTKVYDSALKPAMYSAPRAGPYTPPTSAPAPVSSTPVVPITKADARGQAFEVVTEKP